MKKMHIYFLTKVMTENSDSWQIQTRFVKATFVCVCKEFFHQFQNINIQFFFTLDIKFSILVYFILPGICIFFFTFVISIQLFDCQQPVNMTEITPKPMSSLKTVIVQKRGPEMQSKISDKFHIKVTQPLKKKFVMTRRNNH